MIRSSMTIGLMAITAAAAGAQHPALQDTLESRERESWVAWQKRDGAFFQEFLSDDHIDIEGQGPSTKAAIVGFVSSPACVVKSYSLDHFTLTPLDSNVAALTYHAAQSTRCGGSPVPSPVWITSVYVRRAGRWLNATFQVTPDLSKPATGSAAAGTSAGKPHADAAETTDHFVALDGYRLHTVVEGRGQPVVVFESGMGDGADSWEKVQPAIARIARTVSYDRPGLGKSDKAPELHDLNQSADELHKLLQSNGSPPPYVLVGHSMGGLIVRVFAHRYPNETAGIVLVDPADEGTDDRLHTKLSPEQWAGYREFMTKHVQDPVMHMDMYGMTSGSQAAAASLPAVPTILLSASKVDDLSPDDRPFRETAIELHREWVQRTANAELVAVPTHEHYIQIVAPETVIAAITKVVTAVRR